MGKNFLSFLGTNQYLECSYYFNDPQNEYYPTRFVQISIIRNLIKNKLLNKQSKILIFATEDASKKNWNDSKFKGNNVQGLKSNLESLKKEIVNENLDFPSFERIPLAEGKTQNELWNIFNTLVDNVHKNDLLYVDITHSFRSLPLLTMIVLNFLRVTKNVEIKGIYYGAFESLGIINEIKNMKLEFRNAPIFDLTPFVDLFYWTSAAHEFLTTGNTNLLTQLTKRNVQPILKAKKGLDESAYALNKLSKNLRTFSNNLFINNGPDLPKILTDLFKSIYSAKDHVRQIPPLKDLFDIILESFTTFAKAQNDIEKINFAIEYCFKHGLIQQGFTLLEENFISLGCRATELNFDNSVHRQLFTSALHIQEKKLNKNEWKIKEDQIQIIEHVLTYDLSKYIKFKNTLFPIRNALNHASFTNSNKPNYGRLKEKGYQLLKSFKDLIKDESK